MAKKEAKVKEDFEEEIDYETLEEEKPRTENKDKPKNKVKAKEKPVNLGNHKPEEVVKAIVSFAHAGSTASQIGIILRDQYGIPNINKFLGKGIEKVLAENDIVSDFPRDLLNLIRKSVMLDRHLKENKKDYTAKRGLQLTQSKIRRLTKYYQNQGKLTKEWRYTTEAAALLVK